MVKKGILIAILFTVLFLNGCNSDLMGLFGSNDLNARLSEKQSFKFLTAAKQTLALTEPYQFIVLTDTHIENGNAFGLDQLPTAITSDVKFVVNCGDITQNGKTKDIEKFITIANSLGVPFYPVIGNHDIFFGHFSNWKKLIGSTHYKIDAGSAMLLILDSANGYFGKDQLNWLEKEAKNAKKNNKLVFVFTHCNLFVKSLVDLQQLTDAREAARICSILKGRCDIMFMGHTHDRMEKELGYVHYITVDGFKKTGNYCLVTVNNGSVSWEFKKL